MVHNISDLPEELRAQTAAWVEHGSLPALRLVSRGWNEAANLAVRQLMGYLILVEPAHLERIRLIGQRWPNVERLYLDLELEPTVSSYRQLISSLTPLTRLQHLSLPIAAALLPEGQEFMLRQTQLLSLCAFGILRQSGASDGVLEVISRLSRLTYLECHLQAEHAHLAGSLPPIQLDPATDEGVRCLSSLQSLEGLSLTFSKCPCGQFAVTGHALSSIGSLHQLTRLSLDAWPMVDTDLAHLTHLQLVSLDLDRCLNLTAPGCGMYLSLITSLRELSIGVMDAETACIFTQAELKAFEKLFDRWLPHAYVIQDQQH